MRAADLVIHFEEQFEATGSDLWYLGLPLMSEEEVRFFLAMSLCASMYDLVKMREDCWSRITKALDVLIEGEEIEPCTVI